MPAARPGAEYFAGRWNLSRMASGRGFNGISAYYGVNPEDIINYRGTIWTPPRLATSRTPVSSQAHGWWCPADAASLSHGAHPSGVTREILLSARVLSPGACDPVSGGAVGFGTFIWPANNHHLSGFDYRPDANHWGIDIAGNDGEGV